MWLPNNHVKSQMGSRHNTISTLTIGLSWRLLLDLVIYNQRLMPQIHMWKLRELQNQLKQKISFKNSTDYVM